MSQKPGVCQSCGMPMHAAADFGTEEDGRPSEMYCQFCYQKGVFTSPDITLDQMTEQVAPFMEQAFGMSREHATPFLREQLIHLYRWSGRVIPACESCGMPIATDADAGTEKDGSLSTRYCRYCYQNGAYTEPDLTFEAMIEKGAAMMAPQLGITVEKATEMARSFSATLPRWR